MKNLNNINIVKLSAFQDQEEEQVDTFFENMKNNADELIYIAVDKDGSVSYGHTPLDVRDLVYLTHHLNNIIQYLINKEANYYD